MRYTTSMMARMAQLSGQGAAVGILVIDEPVSADREDPNAVPDHIRDMQTVLVYAGWERHPVWLVELSPGPEQNPTSRTMVRLRGMLPPSTPAVLKKRFNAFEGTNLRELLRAANVTSHLVVMGHEVNCCVKQTVIGGRYKPSTPFEFGAVGLEYTVLTSDRVLSINGEPKGPGGVKADWADHVAVEYYARV
ncbi:MAG: isochorismatase family protein [Labilithrix sp.]|nr:isochorismatase family protein [Labilithrix sp.]MCW5834198.1 isochorismatase family protein [Labilithrix sp.]